MTDYKQLCVELAALAKREHCYCEDSWYSCPKATDGCADDYQGSDCNCGADAHNAKVDALVAALAEPEPEEPTDEAWHEFIEQLRRVQDVAQREGLGPRFDLVAAMQAWIGRPEPPADGEVAQLVKTLRGIAYWSRHGKPGEPAPAPFDVRRADRLTRAASLLERLSPPQPVAVAERLPRPEDCTTNPRTDEGQWCWGWVQHDPLPYSGRWRMIRREWLVDEARAWLPAHALPLPTND